MLAVIGIVYGALVAMVQPDMKKLVAYSSVSHLGFVVLGICAMNVQGVQGAVYQMLNHGVSTGGLFLIVGMLSDRRHTRLIAEFGGLKNVMPRLVGRVPDHHAVVDRPARPERVRRRVPDPARRVPVGSGGSRPFAATGVILSAVYMLWMFQRVNYGPVTNEKNATLPDLSRASGRAACPLVALAIVMGVFPNLFLQPMEPAVERDASAHACAGRHAARARCRGRGAGRRRRAAPRAGCAAGDRRG